MRGEDRRILKNEICNRRLLNPHLNGQPGIGPGPGKPQGYVNQKKILYAPCHRKQRPLGLSGEIRDDQ